MRKHGNSHRIIPTIADNHLVDANTQVVDANTQG